MFLLNTMKDYKLYNNKPFLYDLVDDKKKFKNNLIFLDTKSLKESIELINNPLINNKYTKCYFIEKTNIATIRTLKKKKIINQTNYYKNVKTSCKKILTTYPTLDKYQLLSTYYDLSVLNELFYENAISLSERVKIGAYKNFLNILFDREDIHNYPNKFILCEINEKNPLFDEYKEKSNDFLSMLLKVIKLTPDDISNYPNLKVIVLGNKSRRFFKFNLHSLSKMKLNKIKTLYDIITKLEKGLELSEEENQIDEEAITQEAQTENENASIGEVNKTNAKDMIKDSVKPSSTKEKEIAMKVDEIIDSKDGEDLYELETELNNDEEFLKFMEELKQEKITAELASKNTARNELLKEEQKKIRINNDAKSKTLEEIVNETKEKTITKEEIPLQNKNKEQLKESTVRDFEKSYNENLDYKDKLTILNSFSDDNKEIKLYIRSIKKEDSSTAFTKKETWTIDLEDSRRTRHKIVLDFPTWIDDKFLYIEGNKKILNKQLTLLPIIKSSPDEVQLVTNSNKTFISRFGSKINPKIERFKKFITETKGNRNLKYTIGNNLNINNKFLTNIEYDELSALYNTISIGNDITIYLNQEELLDIFKEKGFKIPNDKKVMALGIKKDSPILYHVDDNIIYTKEGNFECTITDYIVKELGNLDPKVIDKYQSINIGKKYTYTRCSILNRKIPLIIFLAYNEGLSTILHKAKINYEISDKRKRLTEEEKERKSCIPFKDCFLYYDIYPLKNSLLLNALMEINTKDYDFELFNTKEVYLEIFFNLFGSRAIAKGFDNFYELFVDGITKEVLEDLNYPTDVTGMMLFANELLQDNQYVLENEMSNYRIRSNEVLNVYFEKELEDAYKLYKNNINGANSNFNKITIPRDKIIKDLMTSQLLQDYDTLNPITESDSISSVTYKGPGGLYYKVWSTIINHFKCWNVSLSNQQRIYNINKKCNKMS